MNNEIRRFCHGQRARLAVCEVKMTSDQYVCGTGRPIQTASTLKIMPFQLPLQAGNDVQNEMPKGDSETEFAGNAGSWILKEY